MNKFLAFLFLLIGSLSIAYAQPTNLDFSAGTLNGWTLQEGGNQSSLAKTISNIHPSTQYTVFTGPTTDINAVPIGSISPLGGNFIRIGDVNMGGNTYKLSQTFNVDASSSSLSFAYATVMDNGGHVCDEQNYFDFIIKDSGGNIIPTNSSNHSIINGTGCSSGDPSYSTFSQFGYKNWTNLSYDLSAYVGSAVTVEVLVAGCTMYQQAHEGYAYFDAAVCSNTTTPGVVTVNGNPYTLTQNNQNIDLCNTSSVVIWAPPGATTYSWSGGAINGLTTQSVSITQPGIYRLSCDRPFECSNTTQVNFRIGVTPTLAITGATNSACPGVNRQLIANGASSYMWSTVSGTFYNASVSSVYNVAPQVVSVYNVVGKDLNGGCIASLNYTANILPSPTLSVAGSSLICSSAPVNLTVTGADTYTWVTGSNSNSIWVTPTVSTTYSVSGTSISNGCRSVYNHTIFVNSALALNSSNYKVCIGDSINVLASGATSYTWSNGATTSSVTLKPVVTTSYFVNGITGCGWRQTVFTVTVNPLPTLSVTANPPYVCGVNSAYLSGLGTGTLSYSWLPPLGPSGAVTPTISTTYTATGTDFNGCANTQTILISVFPSASVSISSPTSICSGQSATLTANGITSFNWSDGSTTQSIVVSPTSSTTYSVYGSDINGACGSASQSIQISTGTPSLNIAVTNYTACSGNYVIVNLNSPANYLFSTSPPLNVSQNGSNLFLNPAPVSTTIYTINATNSCGVTSSTINVYALITPTVILTGPDTVCASTTYTFNASGASTYNWAYSYGGSYVNVLNPNSFTISPISTFSLLLNGYNNNCSSAYIQKNIIVINELKIATNNTVICSGTSAILTASGSSSYLWSNGSTTNSIIVTPSVSTSYSVVGTSSVSCTNTKTITFNVLQNCQDVWPGDANSDGTADNLDVLELGLHYMQTGAPRASTSNNWQSYFALNWTGTITNGKNLNHSDCNGDGIINDNDTLAIYNNYGLTHAFKPNQTTTVTPQLNIVPDQATVLKGTWGSSSIYLGEAITPVNNINGIAFTVNFDNTLIEPNSIWLEYPASFINTANQNLHFRKLDFSNGKIFTATTHTVNNNVSGNGLVGILHYKILSSLTTDEVLNLNLVQGFKSEVSGQITPLTVGAGTLMALGSSVGLQELNGNVISISPNPTNGSLTINSKTELQKIEVVAITGQVLLSEVPTNSSHTLHLDNFANGIYFVNVYQNNRIVKREKVVLNK